MNFRILTNRFLLGKFSILILMVMAWTGITFPFQFFNSSKPADPLKDMVRSTIVDNGMLIILQDGGALEEQAYAQGAEVQDWSSGRNIEILSVALAARYCPTPNAIQPPLNLYLAWSSPDQNAIYELGPNVRPLYLFFNFTRIFGSDGRLFQLTPRSNILQRFCSARSINQGNPTIIILNDSIYPMISSVQTEEITWMAFQEANRESERLVERVYSKAGYILIDSSIETEIAHSFLEGFAVNNPPNEHGALIQVFP
jgi:hypothetical protein